MIKFFVSSITTRLRIWENIYKKMPKRNETDIAPVTQMIVYFFRLRRENYKVFEKRHKYQNNIFCENQEVYYTIINIRNYIVLNVNVRNKNAVKWSRIIISKQILFVIGNTSHTCITSVR